MSGNGGLRQRVAQANGGGTPGAEVERRDSLKAQIERMMPEYQMAMPKGMEAAQLVRDALTCLRKIDHLAECEPASVLGALMTTAQLGLRPAVLGHAWPLPYWDGRAGGYKAQLVIGYQGYVELGYRSGRISAITSRIVRHGEKFTLVYHEDRDELTHEPSADDLPGEIRAFYSTARLVNGGYTVTEPWSLARMEAHREKHAPRNKQQAIVGPWKDNFPEMGQKTMVLVNYKLLPKSAEMSIAMEADGGLRLDLSPTANAGEVTQHPVISGRAEPADSAPANGGGRSEDEEARLRDDARRAAEEAGGTGR